jgi:hypothetical protein
MADPIQLIYPVGQGWPVSQSYARHVARAKENGWCSKPGNCPSKILHGGIDWVCPTGTRSMQLQKKLTHVEVRTRAMWAGKNIQSHTGMATPYTPIWEAWRSGQR